MALMAVTLARLFWVLGTLARDRRGTLDFAILYTAGAIVRQGMAGNLYDVVLQEKIEDQYSQGGPFLPFDHPPFEALLFAPFALFSYPHALELWAAANLAMLCLLVYLLRATSYRLESDEYLTWLGLCLVLVIAVMLLGQDTFLLALVFLLGYLALKGQRDYLAGLAFGLGLFRFEILLPLAFIFLLRRRWRFLAGFSTAGLTAVAVSIGMVGWRGMMAYGRILLKIGAAAGTWGTIAEAATMPSLRGLVATLFGRWIPGPLLFPAVLVGSVALLCWAAWQFQSAAHPEAPSYDLEFALATVAALLASYHLFVHELTPLLVAAFPILGYEGARRREGLAGNRGATALLLLVVLVYGVGGGVFHFRQFSVVAIPLLGLMAWLAGEASHLRRAPAAQWGALVPPETPSLGK
ncbi:MAG TPA: glycosyltransferase family 87 protein [Candidatus Acidoferrales bacterium]|nr:glycosyltransferase family 87 protein [Candidatus Acidoferrales bacterium]